MQEVRDKKISRGDINVAALTPPAAVLAAAPAMIDAIEDLKKVYNSVRYMHGYSETVDLELQPPKLHVPTGEHAFIKILRKHGLQAHGYVCAAPWKTCFLRDVHPIQPPAPLDTCVVQPETRNSKLETRNPINDQPSTETSEVSR